MPTLYDLVYTVFEEPSHIGSRGGGGGVVTGLHPPPFPFRGLLRQARSPEDLLLLESSWVSWAMKSP